MQTKLVRCSCKDGDNVERQRRYLESIDGLTPNERLIDFDVLVAGKYNSELAQIVRDSVARKRGILTVTGKPGTGKTTMLICAVNTAKAANIQAVYAPMADLLDYLRKAYSPDSRISADKRWDLLTTVDILAIDELDQFNTTPWAMEKFLHLIEIRWRNLDRNLTLCATNVPLNELPEKVESRLRDGRAVVYETHGPDMRRFSTW
jgi:DNA replication protein DnaC